jgi:hypothetical protein
MTQIEIFVSYFNLKLYQFGFGGTASPGGQLIRQALIAHHSNVFPGSQIMRIWSPAYSAQWGTMKEHSDAELSRVRTVYGVTQDGSSRLVGIRDVKGGIARVFTVQANGEVVVLKSKPGQQLVFEVPSGGSYTMTGPGSGAADDLGWQHEPKISKTASMALIIDHHANLASQQAQMTAALAYLQNEKSHHEPAKLPSLSTVIDFKTTSLDKSEGIIISLNHYWSTS